MDIGKEISSNEWYGQGLNAVPLIFESATSSVFSLRKTLGFGYIKFYCAYKGKYCEGNYWKKDIDRLAKVLLKKLADKDYVHWLADTYEEIFNKHANVFSMIDDVKLTTLETEDLIALAQQSNTCIREALGVAHIIEPFSLVADEIIKRKLDEELSNSRKANEVFSLLVCATQKPFISAYDEMLTRLRKEKNAKKRLRFLAKIKREFFWIKNGYAGRNELTDAMIVEESKDASYSPVAYASLRKKKDKLMTNLHLSAELIHLVRTAEAFAVLQDKRKKNSLIAIDYFCRVIDALAKKVPLTKKEIMYLMPHELDMKHLHSTYVQKVLQKRMIQFVLVNHKGNINSTTKKVFHKNHEDSVQAINGMPTCMGVAVGQVKICKNISQISKVEKGDVLVTPMTRPEYVPAMKKAVAIVTDEGGVTSHAAVVARELSKPCIIGTKTATKTLKDGDLVEVNANHGIVKMLKRN